MMAKLSSKRSRHSVVDTVVPSSVRALSSATNLSVTEEEKKQHSPTTLTTAHQPSTILPDDAELAIIKSRRIVEGLEDIYDNFVANDLMDNGMAACLIFAQEYAGSAVCITPSGIILTCCHCLEDEDEQPPTLDTRKTLIFADGTIVITQCIAYSIMNDTALLQIIGKYVPRCTSSFTTTTNTSVSLTSIVQSHQLSSRTRKHSPSSSSKRATNAYEYVPLRDETITFPYLSLLPLSCNPYLHQTCYCVGQPGQDDLESSKARRTGYSYIFCSEGSYLGIVSPPKKKTTTTKKEENSTIRTSTSKKKNKRVSMVEKDNDITDAIMDNYEIGQLKHDCWTYWGHSGAPIFISIDQKDKRNFMDTMNEEGLFLIGLHSSWDDRTGMRHGIHIEAIRRFIVSVLPTLPSTAQRFLSNVIVTENTTITSSTSASSLSSSSSYVLPDATDDDHNVQRKKSKRPTVSKKRIIIDDDTEEEEE